MPPTSAAAVISGFALDLFSDSQSDDRASLVALEKRLSSEGSFCQSHRFRTLGRPE